MKKGLTILIACTALWCAGIILAPVLSHSLFSNILYRLYGTVCHQFDSHSFHYHNAPLAVCARCTSIYFGFLGALLIVRFASAIRRREFSPAAMIVISGMPIALDGLLSLTHFYDATMISRIFSGTLFGAGIAFLLHKTLSEIIYSFIKKFTTSYEPKT